MPELRRKMAADGSRWQVFEDPLASSPHVQVSVSPLGATQGQLGTGSSQADTKDASVLSSCAWFLPLYWTIRSKASFVNAVSPKPAKFQPVGVRFRIFVTIGQFRESACYPTRPSHATHSSAELRHTTFPPGSRSRAAR
jgi:hypothetical protein